MARNYIENHRNCLGDISFRFPSESPCRFSIHGNQRSRKTTFIRIGNVPKHSHWILTSSLQLHLAVSCAQRTRLGSEWEELLTLNEKQYVVVCCSYCWAGLKKWKLETSAYVLKVLKTHAEWCRIMRSDAICSLQCTMRMSYVPWLFTSSIAIRCRCIFVLMI